MPTHAVTQSQAGAGLQELWVGRTSGGRSDEVDLLRIDNDQIAEVWLFSSDQEAENAFWGNH